MVTVSELLKKARYEKRLELSDAERETRIKRSFLKALEEGHYDKLPSATYARGFLKNYAQFLGLNIETVLALFRREFDEGREQKLLPSGFEKISGRRLRITSVALLVIILLVLLLSYFFVQYRDFFVGPPLTLIRPLQNEEVRGDTVSVEGRTDPDTVLTINNKTVALSEDGSFREEVPVLKGEFTILVTAKDRNGRQSKVVRKVRVSP